MLNPAPGYLAQWRDVLRTVRGRAEAATFVHAQLGLPELVADFTGRAAQLRRLATLSDRPVVITGMAGVGKTGLAVHAGHHLVRSGQVADVLFVNLRGFHPDPSQPPVDPAAVLDSFLRLLGVSGAAVPADLNGKMRAYRRQLAGRRLLVVLDNALDEAQVQPLLPGAGDSPVLITSRRRLTGLREAEHVELSAFTPREAVTYLRHAVGADRIAVEPAAAAQITRQLGYLPLALTLTAMRITADRGWTLAEHLERLQQRGEHLRLDDAVEASISLSYEQLPIRHRRTLRMLALHPGPDTDIHAVAALAGVDLPQARRGVNQLVAASLVSRTEAGRYELHDLIRAFAVARSHDEDSPTERRSAIHRLGDYYVFTASRALDHYAPRGRLHRPRIPDPGLPTPTLDGRRAATAWLDSERANLVSVATGGVRSGHAGSLSWILFRYLQTGGHSSEALALHGCAVGSADQVARGHALVSMAATYGQIGRYELATGFAERALDCFRAVGDQFGECRAVGTLGAIESWWARFDRSADYQQQALRIAAEIGDHAAERTALTNLGFVYGRLGRHAEALEIQMRALAIDQETGDHCDLGRTLLNIGDTYLRSGGHHDADVYFQRAATIADQAGDRDLHVEALLCLADCATEQHLVERAESFNRSALTMATQLGELHQVARAHAGLARTFDSDGDRQRARQHWLAARDLYRELNLPEAAEIDAKLS